MTKIEAADRVIFCIVLAAGSNVGIVKTWSNACILSQICAIS